MRDVVEVNKRKKNESLAAKKRQALQKEQFDKMTVKLNDWTGSKEGTNAVEEI